MMSNLNPLIRGVKSEIRAVADLFMMLSESEFRKIRYLSGTKSGKSAFVFANGPSLSQLDQKKFGLIRKQLGADLFTVNYYLRSSLSLEAGPNFHILSDPESFSQHDLAALAGEMEGVDPSPKLVVPARFRNAVSHLPCEIIYFNDSESRLSRLLGWTSPLLPRGYVSMTAYKALAIAQFMKYDEIYILGFDNSYASKLRNDRHNRVYRTDSHFDAAAYSDDSEPNYYYHDNGLDMSKSLKTVSLLFSDLKKFERTKIFNLDCDSLVDAFPKKSLDALFDELDLRV